MTDREKFEAWYCKNYSKSLSHMERHENSGDYFCRQTRAAWRAWQAALASQQPADDDWVEWGGGESESGPVGDMVFVCVKSRDGNVNTDYAVEFDWAHYWVDEDIIAYRVGKP